MKILILSHNPVTDYNSMGKTMLSLFSKVQKEELIQFYIYPTIPNIQKCSSYYRVTDKEVIKSIVTLKKPGRLILREEIQAQNPLFEKENERKLFSYKDRLQIYCLICRCLIWKFGHWKTKNLKQWLNEEKPDCIFAAPGQSTFFYDIIFYFSKKWNLPINSYFCDDFYQSGTAGNSFLSKLYKKLLKNKIKKLILQSNTILTISDALKEAYNKEFGCHAITITTGTNFDISETTVTGAPNVMAYFGSLELGRNVSLAKIGGALDRINDSERKNYQLNIHSDVLNQDRLKVFDTVRSIQVMPFVPGNQVFAFMIECCVLVYTESFDLKYRDRIRYSLSTKIADSLASGVCLLAFAPGDTASMEYLTRHGCAVVVTEEKELDSALGVLMQSDSMRNCFAEKGLAVAHQNHDSEKQGILIREILEKSFSMKIMQVNCVYKKGSTGRLMEEISNKLKKDGHTSIICYGRGKKIKEVKVYKTASELFSKMRKVISGVSGMHYNKCLFPTLKLFHIIKKEHPDIVHLHCINGYFVNIYQLIGYLKRNHIPTVLTLHAEFMYTGNCPHAEDCLQWIEGCQRCPGAYPAARKSFLRMKEAFENFNDLYVISVSSWLMDRAKMSSVLGARNHATIENGVNTDIFHYYSRDEVGEEIRTLFSGKTVIHVTPNYLDENKGGRFVICMAKLLPQIRFLIVGYNGQETLPSNVTGIRYLQSQNELSMFYSLADVTLLTSRKETFGMVAAESLCCGTPVVGFLSGGPETIVINEYSSFSAYGDTIALKEDLLNWLELEYDKKEISRAAVKKYDNQLMYEQYHNLYKGILSNGKNK